MGQGSSSPAAEIATDPTAGGSRAAIILSAATDGTFLDGNNTGSTNTTDAQGNPVSGSANNPGSSYAMKAMSSSSHAMAEKVVDKLRVASGASTHAGLWMWRKEQRMVKNLEKQVKTAFDKAKDPSSTVSELSGDDDYLPQDRLDAFLECMGCAPPSTSTVTGHSHSKQDPLAKLKKNLWSQLDPHQTGKTDLLTLTVFFHVLTGAIDAGTLNSLEVLG